MRIDEEEVYRCPRRPLKDDPLFWNEMMLLYHHYRAGHLPDAGGVTRQASRAMNLFRVLDNAVNEAEQVLLEERRSKQG